MGEQEALKMLRTFIEQVSYAHDCVCESGEACLSCDCIKVLGDADEVAKGGA